jgi:Protein of unknown function (DUF4058)
MRSPFYPCMDPYLEHPALWPDVHSSLISAIRDALVPLVTPKYYVGVEQRTHLISSEDLDAGLRPMTGFTLRPDVLVAQEAERKLRLGEAAVAYEVVGAIRDIEVEVPLVEITETYLEIRSLPARKIVTTIEVLSPTNKQSPKGRAEYLAKRDEIFSSRTHLVEIDLLRTGEPMPVTAENIQADYRVFISRWEQRPRARLIAFDLPQKLPAFEIPLLKEDPSPTLDLGAVLHALYERARYDLWNDYTTPPVPPIRAEHADWVRRRIEHRND